MTIEHYITIGVATFGWSWAFYQRANDRKRLKRDKLSDRRFTAYSSFMIKMDEMNCVVRNNPNAIFGISQSFLSKILKPDADIDNLLLNFNQELLNYVKNATIPLLIINQEINSLLLISSNDLTIKLKELKSLITDFNNEMQSCLTQINAKDANSFKVFETIGHNNRWQRFTEINEEIVQLMRIEING